MRIGAISTAQSEMDWMSFKHYEMFLANLEPIVGSEICQTRPVIIVSPDALNGDLETVVVCPLTTTLHPRWRTRIQLHCAGKKAEVALDQNRTLSKMRLIKKIDLAPASEVEEIRLGLTFLCGQP